VARAQSVCRGLVARKVSDPVTDVAQDGWGLSRASRSAVIETVAAIISDAPFTLSGGLEGALISEGDSIQCKPRDSCRPR